MKKKIIISLFLIVIIVLVIGTIVVIKNKEQGTNQKTNENNSNTEGGYIEMTDKNENDFQIDLVYHSPSNRDIHYSAYIPSNIDSLEEVPLYITLPGYEGLYFQGVGVNLRYEDFAYIAKELNPNMIILAPQLNDWGKQSAEDTILLTEYYQENYKISNTYINGYSGGGETLSLVLDMKPELYTRALLVSSQWDGGYEKLVNSNTQVYFFIGESDSYYGSSSFKETYNELYKRYEQKGLSKEDIDKTLILDVRNHEYFTSHGISDEHGGGGLAAHEESIMKWLLEIE